MKKLLIPLIILLLIIGYFMSRSGEHKAKEAYDSMNQPKSEQMNDNSMPTDSGSGSDSSSPNGTSTPPDGMGNPDTQMPQESDQTDPVPPGDSASNGEGAGTMGAESEPGEPGGRTRPPGEAEAAMPSAGDDSQVDEVLEDASKEANKAVEGAENPSDTDTGTDEGMESNPDQPQR